MRWIATLIVLAPLLAGSGCALPEALYNLGGNQYYSDGGTDYASRDAHFNAELGRWKQYENER